ncbi:restriction endonuclease subunit S [Tenacibaculum maritimum]|uniref:restriction endonuclease subunit S n=1 Tax=Tenacibaculum maritimum TaxID=107401 RepID=UPI00387688FA
MEKYHEYKDSGIEWLGEIPEHWEIKRIKDVIKVSQGLQISRSERFHKPRENTVQYNTIPSIQGKIEEYIYKPSKNVLCTKEEMLVVRTGSGVGKILTNIEGAFHNNFFKAKNNKTIASKFCYFLLISYNTQFLMRSYAGLTAIPDLNHSDFYSIFFTLPKSKEQTQIANYLDIKTTTIDKKITLLEQKIKHYKAYRKTLINKIVTKGLDKTAKLKDSGVDWIGDIPEHWEIRRYKSFGKTIKGKNMETSDVEFENSLPLLSLEYLRNDSVQHPTFCYSNDKSLKSTDDDLIIVWDGAAVGEIIKSKIGYVSSTIAKLDINNKKFNTKYFYHLRGAIDYKLKQIPTGMGIPHLNPTLFKNFKCPAPPIKEQQQIANYLDTKTTTIDKIVNNIEAQITMLKELRKTLINEVVTGKVKVTSTSLSHQKASNQPIV